MTRCIDPDGYADGHDLRTDRVLSLFRLLQSCRGRQIDETDTILDIGCGPKSALPRFWNLTLSKILPSETTYPRVVGIDLEPDCEPGLPNGFEYQQADVNDWQVPSGFRQKFSLITSIYSWHWIMGACDSETAQARAVSLYSKVEELLQSDGRLAIQHLYTDDTMPEITKIALEAMRRSGLKQVNSITPDEYKQRRAKTWRIPKLLPDVAQSFSGFRDSHPATTLSSEFIAGSTSWHWKDTQTIWSFWKSVNLPRFFRELSPEDCNTLQRAFAHVLTEKSLEGLGLCSTRHRESLYVRITVKSAHEIIRKGATNEERGPTVILRPDLPNQVRARLAEKISDLEFNDPWFGSEGTLIPDASSHDLHTEALLTVLKPVLSCVDDATARIFSINLRQVSITDGNSLGRMRNVGPTNSDAERIQSDGEWLRQLKLKGVPTISEVVLSTVENPPEVVVFVGEPWTNHRDWYSFTRNTNAEWKTSLIPSVVVLWVSSKNPAKLALFEPGNVVCADYLWEIAGWHDNLDIVEFLHFLLGQLRDDKKSTFLATSNSSIEGDSRRRDSVSISIFQNLEQTRNTQRFPEITDCFLLIDALQELALIGERIRSRETGEKDLISAASHEQSQVVDFIFSSLLNQPLQHWFTIGCHSKPDPSHMGCISVPEKFEEQLADCRIIPSVSLLETAKGFLGLWGGSRIALSSWFYAANNKVTLESAANWAAYQASRISALEKIRTLALAGFSDWPRVKRRWEEHVHNNQRRFAIRAENRASIHLVQPSGGDEAEVEHIRSLQTSFLRALLAMLTNALKYCPREQTIAVTVNHCSESSRIRVAVKNPLGPKGTSGDKTDGTESVMKLCAQRFGGFRETDFAFGPCGAQGQSKTGVIPTHWIASISFPIVSTKQGSPWIQIATTEHTL